MSPRRTPITSSRNPPRNSPRRARNIALAWCIIGAIVAPASFLLAERLSDTAHLVLFCAGLMALIYGGTAALIHHGRALSFDRFTASENVVARWTVDSDTWRDFVALEERLRGAAGQRGNELAIAKEEPPRAVEVVVGREAVQIGEQFHSFHVPGQPTIEYVARASQYPHYLELGYYRGDASFPRDNCLRFPFPASAQAQAIAVQQHYEAFEAARAGGAPIAIRSPRAIYVAGLVLLAVAAAVAAFGAWRYSAGERSDLMAGLAIGGAIVAGSTALVLAIVYLFRWAHLRGQLDQQ